MTADTIIALNEKSLGIAGQSAALIIGDIGTDVCECRAMKTKGAATHKKAISEFKGPYDTITHMRTDGSKELETACEQLELPHDTSTPGRPESNARAERRNRIVLEGARTTLNAG